MKILSLFVDESGTFFYYILCAPNIAIIIPSTLFYKITKLNEKVATIEYKKIVIKNEIDILNGNAHNGGNRIPISSHAVIKYQPVKEFSLEIWDLMLEKVVVYKNRIEFVWKE